MISVKVLDISHHNSVADGGFAQMYDFGIRGVILKSTQGSNYIDPTYYDRRMAAAEAGMLVGAYHFADDTDPIDQVNHFIAAAGADPSILMALDFEPNGPRTMTLEGARAFLKECETQLGRKAVLYSGNLIKEKLPHADDFFGAHRLWLAQYGTTPRVPPSWSKPWLWQFSGDGINSQGIKIPGISGQIDMNSYDGTDDDLVTEWAS